MKFGVAVYLIRSEGSSVLTAALMACLLQQREFLLARQREREGRTMGRGSPGARARGGYGGYDGFESEDSMDSFIDDGDEDDWRSHLRNITRRLIASRHPLAAAAATLILTHHMPARCHCNRW